MCVGIAAVAALVASAPQAQADPGKVSVVGGSPVAITAAPWQVYVLTENPAGACGGSILDATHVLTAGHCIVPPGAPQQLPPSSITVLAGASNVSGFAPGRTPPPGSQVSRAASLRVHPNFVADPQLTDDVAIITLARALNLSTPNAKPIALAGAAPAPGSTLGFTGYGQQRDSQQPDGKLYAASLTAIGDDDCRDVLSTGASPVAQCAHSPTSATCLGDSGSALTTTGGPPAVLGVASFVRLPCGSSPSGFADVTAPEVRAFIDGAAQIPIAPRQTAPAIVRFLQPPVNGSPLTCEPGAWDGSPTMRYTFKTDSARAEVLQNGESSAYTPRGADLGKTIVCVVEASNPGGTATARSGATPSITTDIVSPRVAVRSARCSRRRCRVALVATDPNSQGALRIRVKAIGCRKRGCTRKLKVKQRDATTYRATGRRPRGRRPRIAVRVTDAAGNRAGTKRVRAR